MIAGLLGGALLLAGNGLAATDSGSAPPEATANTVVSGDDVSASPCSGDDFTADLIPQPIRPGSFLLAVTNTSQQTCEVDGWPNVVGQNMKGDPLTEVPTATVEVPGAPTATTLEPGETAFAGLHAELGDKSDPNTYVASGFTAYLPDIGGGINADPRTDPTGEESFALPVKSLRIGSLQPSSQGVVF